jgi:HlyD family secretion protein
MTKMEEGDINSIVQATGEIKPKTLVEVGCQVTGKILKLFVDFNSVVTKGQLLAQIDPIKYQTQVTNSKVALLTSQKQLAIACENRIKYEAQISALKNEVLRRENILKNKKKDYERYKILADKNLVAKTDANTYQNDYLATEVDLKNSKERLKEAELNYNIQANEISKAKADIINKNASLVNSEADLSYTRILSPIDGVIISKSVEEGQTLVSTFQTSTMFKIANDLSKMEVFANINESDSGVIKKGQNADVTVDAFPDKVFKGTITQFRNEKIEIDKSIYYNAIISIDNKELLLKPGMTAQVTIITSNKKNVFKIPIDATRFIPTDPKISEKLKAFRSEKNKLKPGTGESRALVWVMKPKGPEPVAIITGASDDDHIEFVKGPLKPNDQIIVKENPNE